MFGEKLYQRRKQLSLTQEQLADKISLEQEEREVTRQTVSKWENGNCLPEVKTLLTLIVLLDIPFDELFEDELAVLRKEKVPDTDFFERYPGAVALLKQYVEIAKLIK